MRESTKKASTEQKENRQEELEPCVTPQSSEAKRSDKIEDACDDGVK